MRNNLKHLALGMALGAVVVFIYGVNKLTPFTKRQDQTSKSTLTTKTEDISVDKLLEPKIAEYLQVSFDKEVQLLKNYKQYYNDPMKIKDDISQPAMDKNQTTHKNEADTTKTGDTIEEIIEREVAYYIYERPKTDLRQAAFYQFEPPFVTEERNQTPTSTPEPTPTPKQSVAYSVMTRSNTDSQTNQNHGAPADIIALIEKYALEYGVDKNMMIGIAKCESGFRENAVNGPYAGIYQFVSGTWISNRRAMGLDENLELRYNTEESIRTAAFKMSRDGFGAWPVCQYKAQGLVASARSI